MALLIKNPSPLRGKLKQLTEELLRTSVTLERKEAGHFSRSDFLLILITFIMLDQLIFLTYDPGTIEYTLKTTQKVERLSYISKLTKKPQQKNTNENVHSVTTCKKGQQKQRSRFLQEYKSETSYTLEDGHVGRNM
jgi:hypothetical protein